MNNQHSTASLWWLAAWLMQVMAHDGWLRLVVGALAHEPSLTDEHLTAKLLRLNGCFLVSYTLMKLFCGELFSKSKQKKLWSPPRGCDIVEVWGPQT